MQYKGMPHLWVDFIWITGNYNIWYFP